MCDMSESHNPTKEVRASCAYVCEHARSVTINDEAIIELANEMSERCNAVAWDEGDWHYCKDAKELGPRTCQYIFVMDSLNFCFWPVEGLEYDTLALALKNVLEKDENIFDAVRLCNMTEDTLQSWFSSHQIPLLTERTLRLQEVISTWCLYFTHINQLTHSQLGISLLENFDGFGANLVKQAGNSAVKLVQLVLQYLQGFRDTAIYDGKLIHFYKRAQILVGDLWAAYGRPRENSSIYYFNDIRELTMFADYRVPQILRELNILTYDHDLAENVDSLVELPFSCREEIEIRACSVIAVERLHKILVSRGWNDLLVIEIDWLLWQRGEVIKDTIKPHHRVLTIYY